MMLRLPAALALLALLLAGCGGCRKEDAGAGDGPFRPELVAFDAPASASPFLPVLDGPLRVLAATPSGSMVGIGPEQGVAVSFTKPVVPLGEAPAPPADALTLDPAVPGTLRWEGGQTLVFQPAAPLPPATRFTARLRAAGLRSLDGEALARDTTWTFETPRPGVVAAQPAAGETFASPTAPFRLDFNQPVAAAQAEASVVLETGGRRVALDALQAGDSAVVLRHAPLEKGATYRLIVRPGLRGRGGPLPSEAPDTTTFRVAPVLRFEGLAQSEGYGQERTASPFDPERGLTLRFATPVRAGDVRRALRFTPAVAWPAGIEAGDGGEGTAQTFRLPFAPETDYTLALTGLRDVFGQALAPTTARFRTSALQPSLRVPEGVMVVEAGPNGALPLRATNVPGVLVSAEKLTPATLIPRLLAYDAHHYYGERDESARPQPRTPTRLAPLGLRRNVPGKAPLRFDSLLSAGPDGVRTGVVGFALRTPALGGEDALQLRKGLAQVTRLGLTVKHSPLESLVLVTDLGTAQPLAGVRVTVRGLDNRVRWTGQTGRDGRVAVPGWSRLGIASDQAWQKPIQFVFAERGADFAFTSNLFEDGLEPWRFDVSTDWNPKPETFAGVVFSDRGLYRAGETVSLKGWLRRRTSGDWAVAQDSVRLVVLDARGRGFLDRRVRLSDLGAFDLTLPIPAGAAQGVYGVSILKARDTVAVGNYDLWQHELASGRFQVESFRTASFRVQADPAAEAYVSGERFEATLSGHFLFGAAMGGAPMSYSLTQRPSSFVPEGYDGWRFGAFDPGDAFYESEQGATEQLYSTLLSGDATLDAEGRLPLAAPLAPSTTGVPLELSLQATVTDPSRQQQSDETRVTLHPGLFYVGLRPKTSYLDLSRGQDLEVDVVTIDPGGVPVGARVDVELLREEWTSVREVGADGRLRWVSNRREEAKGAQSVTTAPGTLARLRMPVAEGGTYRVRASARDVRGNVIRTETYFFAAGSGYVAWHRADDDRIDLIPDRRTAYAPGETARILVQSPFEEATALVTVEREGVMHSEVVTLRGSAPQIEIPLTDAHLPNAFVSVILLTGRAAQPTANADVGAPQFRAGYATLRVDAGARHLRVEVEASQAEVRPGEEVEVNLRLVDRNGRGVAGEVAFSAADAGVVDLIRYTLPDPYDSFYGPRALAVTTTESRSVLVDQRAFGQKEEDSGGGGGDPERLRKDFRPLAFWAPSLRTGRDGRATVRFRVPERLTTLRLMASAATADHRFGNGLGQTMVTQPLVLTPALPRFARQGDQFEAGVLVTNRMGAPGEAVVQAQSNGLALSGSPQRVTLARGETREVRFRFGAPRAGNARVAFTGTLGKERDGLEAPLRVDVPAVREASATFARVDAPTTLQLAVPADRITASVTARLSSTALAGLGFVTRDLVQYPYGCLEQRTSAARAFLAGRAVLQSYDAATLALGRPRVEAWLTGLEGFWTGEGFTLWPGGTAEVHPYASAYTILALAEAKAAGYAVPEALTAEAVAWLAARVRRASEKPDWLPAPAWNDTRALMLYALARHGQRLDAEIQALATAPLTAEGEALLLRATAAGNRPALAAVRVALAQRLRSRLRLDGTAAFLDAGPDAALIFGSDVRATAFGLAALAEVLPAADAPVLAGLVRGLVGQRPEAQLSTQEGATLVEALGLYAQRFEQAAPALRAQVRALGRDVVRASFDGRSLAVPEGTLGGLPGGNVSVEVNRTGTGALYLALRLESLVRPGRAPLNAGLALARSFELLDARTGQGRALTADAQGRLTVPAGTLVRVTLRLSSATARAYVAVDDALPAGLEVLNAALATTDQAVLDRANAGQGRYWGSFSHTETRDDRVLLFADRLSAGEHTFTYVARATTPGTYVLPPAHAELMYRPEVQARTAVGAFVVR